jgi:hypothetical protein
VGGPRREVALVQVVGADPEGEEPLVEIGEDPRGRVHAPEEHGLVLDRHAVIDEPLARLARLGRALLRMVEVRDHEERREPAEQRREVLGDPHRAGDGGAGGDPQELDVGDRAQAGEDLLEPAVGEDERIAARDDHVAHLRVGADVGDPLLHRGAVEAAVVVGERDPAAGAVAAVDRAAVDREEQDPVSVLVDHRAGGAVRLLADRVQEIAGRGLALVGRRDRLHPDRAGGVIRVDERGVVRRHRHPEAPVREREPAALRVREAHHPPELGGCRERASLLPAPVAPVRVGRAGKEISDRHGVGRARKLTARIGEVKRVG